MVSLSNHGRSGGFQQPRVVGEKGAAGWFAPAMPAAQEEVVEAPEIFSFGRPVSRCLLAVDHRASQKTW